MSHPPRRLASYAAYLFDVDGTLVYHDHAVPGVANALEVQGTRSAGAQATELLAQAVAAYRSVLEVYTREQLPQDWAAIFEISTGSSSLRPWPTAPVARVLTRLEEPITLGLCTMRNMTSLQRYSVG